MGPLHDAMRWVSPLFLAAISAACGSSSNSGTSGAAGSSGTLASTGSGTTGSTGTGAGGSGSSDPGAFDSIWKRQSARVNVIDPAAPSTPSNVLVNLPATITEPVDGRELDMYQQILNDKLLTFAYRTGDSAYYRIEQPATKINDSYIAGSSGTTYMFTIMDGRLVDQTSSSLGSGVYISEATYVKYAGAFPPSTWPAQVIDFK